MGLQDSKDLIIEEVDPVGGIGLGLLLWEELCLVRLLHHIGDQVYNAALVVLWNHDRAQLGLRDEVLLSGKDLLDEVFGELLLGWQVILP